MATAAVLDDSARCKKSATIYDCPICLEEFKTPKYLPCSHTFCEICLQTYVESTANSINKTNFQFMCPVCRTAVTGPSSNINNWAAGLPFNHLIFSLMTDEKTKNKTTYNCDPCARVGNDVDAVKWCQNCNELLCNSCLKNFHRRLKNSENHNVLSITEGQTAIPNVSDNNINEPCTEHEGKSYEVYCVDHCQMCCVLCLAKHHRQCLNIKTIDDVIGLFVAEKHVKAVRSDLEFLGREISNLITKRTNEIARIQKEGEGLMLESWNQIDIAIARLKQMKSDLKSEISKTCSLETKPFQIQIDMFKLLNEDLRQNLSFLIEVQTNGSEKQVFLTLQKIQKCLKQQQQQFVTATEGETEIALFNVALQPSLISFIRATGPVFEISKTSRCSWKDIAKTEITKKFDQLNERFMKIAKDTGSRQKMVGFDESNNLSVSQDIAVMKENPDSFFDE